MAEPMQLSSEETAALDRVEAELKGFSPLAKSLPPRMS